MLETFLGIHIAICIIVAVLMMKNIIKVSGMLYPAVVFLPVCGLILLFLEIQTNEKEIRGNKDAGMGKVTIDDVKYRQFPVEEKNEQAEAVPLEEAILVNDAHTKRGLLMEVLQRNPEDYIELLKKARMSDDTELTHYATTTMMEIQSGYELSIHEIENLLEQEESYKNWSSYKNQLKRYIDSGLISGSILAIYREKLVLATEKIMSYEPENRKIVWESIENLIELGNFQKAEELIVQCYGKWFEDEQLYQLMVTYCWETGKGEKIPEVLTLITKNEVYLSSEGKKWFDFWSKKEQVS